MTECIPVDRASRKILQKKVHLTKKMKPSIKIFLALTSEFDKKQISAELSGILNFFFDTKTSEAKPSEFAIRSHKAKPSVTERA